MRILINKIIKIEKILREKRYTTLAGTLSFFLILSLVPTLFLAIYLFSKLNININIENVSLDRNIKNLVVDLVRKAELGNFSYFILLTSLYSGSTLFVHLIKTGEIIYQRQREKITLFSRLTAIIWLIAFLFLICLLVLVHLLLSEYLTYFFKGILFNIISLFYYFFILYSLCLYLHRFIVPFDAKYKEIKNGALLSVSLWILVTIGFLIYVNYFSNFDFLYGTLSFFIIFLLYIYLLMQCFIIGVIYNHYYFQKNAEKNLVKGK